MTTEILKVEGMSCAHCEHSIKQAVTALNGVKDVKVALSSKKVTIEYDTEKLTLDTIKNAIEEAGYEVK
jgi:copper chaperone